MVPPDTQRLRLYPKMMGQQLNISQMGCHPYFLGGSHNYKCISENYHVDHRTVGIWITIIPNPPPPAHWILFVEHSSRIAYLLGCKQYNYYRSQPSHTSSITHNYVIMIRTIVLEVPHPLFNIAPICETHYECLWFTAVTNTV